MTDLAPSAEAVVGVSRHETEHYARTVSSEQRVYILHSRECRNLFDDLRDCPFSKALDRGIRMEDWHGHEDQAVRVWVSASTLRLIPMGPPILKGVNK